MKTVYAQHMFNFINSGSVESFCDSGCCKTIQHLNLGDTVEKTFGSGFLLKLSDGTMVRTKQFEIVRLPKDVTRNEEMVMRGNKSYPMDEVLGK